MKSKEKLSKKPKKTENLLHNITKSKEKLSKKPNKEDLKDEELEEIIWALKGNEKIVSSKLNFVNHYVKNAWNVSKSSKAAGISSMTFYRWIKEDTKFQELIAVAEKNLVHSVMNTISKFAMTGDMKACGLIMKYAGKRAGFTERQEVAHEGIEGIKVVFE